MTTTMTIDWFIPSKNEILQKALQAFKKTKEQLEEDEKIIKKWLETQPHLPEIPSDNHIRNFLLMNKFSIENTKEKIDMYYTIRNLLPEIYNRKIDTIFLADMCYKIPMPKVTEDGERILVFKMAKDFEELYNAYEEMGFFNNIYEVRLNEDYIMSDVIIEDLQNLRMEHIVKITPIHVWKFVTILEKVFSTMLKRIHILNCPPYAMTLLNLFKKLIKPKLAERIFVHKEVSDLKEYIPADLIPSDYGGTERSLYELNELWKEKLLQYEDRFEGLTTMRTNEKLRSTPLVNDEILGYHGNFKKLDMD